jgi:NAD kinase
MFKKITILLKKDLQIEEKVTDKIKEIFSESKIKIILLGNLTKNDLTDSDLVITIGGDGTFVRAANLIENSLVLGINSNPKTSEGALTSIAIDEIDKLKQVEENKFKIIERQRAEVVLNNKILDEKAINEVYVGTLSQFHISRYKIKFKDKEEEQRSSGILVSTGTGSRAWFLSARGKPFNPSEKKLCFIVREPYFGKRIFMPTLFKGDVLEGEKLEIESNRDFGGIIAINDSVYDFNKGDIVQIKLSEKPLKVIKLK